MAEIKQIKIGSTAYDLHASVADNSDKLDGYSSADFASAIHYHDYLPLSGGYLTGTLGLAGKYELGSKYHYENGCLIELCDANVDLMCAIHITGNSYNSTNEPPINSLYQFYNYPSYDDIIQCSGTNFGYRLGQMKAYIYGGKLYAHIKQTANYQTLNITLLTNQSNLSPIVHNAAAHSSGYGRLKTITPTNVSFDGHSHSASDVGALSTSGGAINGRITQVYGSAPGSIGELYGSAAIQIRENNLVGSSTDNFLNAPTLGFHWAGRVAGSLSLGADHVLYWYNHTGSLGTFKTGSVYGAVWNDYAEYRDQKETVKPGYCVASADDGKVYKTTEKFQACDGIVSDTFGFAIGETDESKTPLAVAGRVLAYCEGNRADYHAGNTVCAGPDGKVCKMTREEIREWPDRIVGIVSEIPEYETWGTGNVEVDGRIWIKVR